MRANISFRREDDFIVGSAVAAKAMCKLINITTVCHGLDMLSVFRSSEDLHTGGECIIVVQGDSSSNRSEPGPGGQGGLRRKPRQTPTERCIPAQVSYSTNSR